LEYIKSGLKIIGKGSSRIVFELDDENVLKVAINEKGLRQNELEYTIGYNNSWYEFITNVFDGNPHNLWIQTEKANKIKTSDFKKIIGYHFNDFKNVLLAESMRVCDNKGGAFYEASSNNYEEIIELDLFQSTLSLIQEYDLLATDIASLNSWGIINRDDVNILAIIDYGTDNVSYKELYCKK
jgi:hypothetical protein